MENFLSKIDKTSCGSCWIWTGARNQDGYGKYAGSSNFDTTYAHRISFGLANGFLPPYPEFELDHTCRNRACVNPSHLEVKTHHQNVLIGHLGKTVRARQIAKTHCPSGHPYDEKNTYTAPLVYKQNGKFKSYVPSRHCKICKLAAHKRWRARKKALHE
jgi:hypothetical protein